jgi:hypothetical protein
MRERGSKSGVKNETPKLQETRESLGKVGIFLLLRSNFPLTKFDFLQRLSAFFNGFLLSSTAFQFFSTAFRFLQRLSNFFNGFPIFLNRFLISSTAFQFSSTAFSFPRNPRKSIYGSKYTKNHYLSFVFPATCSPSFVIPAN